MRSFAYYDLDGLKFITYDEIIKDYYSFWKKRVTNKENLTEEKCVQDWLAANWGYEVKKGEKLERKIF